MKYGNWVIRAIKGTGKGAEERGMAAGGEESGGIWIFDKASAPPWSLKALRSHADRLLVCNVEHKVRVFFTHLLLIHVSELKHLLGRNETLNLQTTSPKQSPEELRLISKRVFFKIRIAYALLSPWRFHISESRITTVWTPAILWKLSSSNGAMVFFFFLPYEALLCINKWTDGCGLWNPRWTSQGFQIFIWSRQGWWNSTEVHAIYPGAKDAWMQVTPLIPIYQEYDGCEFLREVSWVGNKGIVKMKSRWKSNYIQKAVYW